MMFKKRKEVLLELEHIKVSTKNIILTILFSLVLSILIFMGPIALCVNLYIFNDIRYFACFLIATFIGLIYYFTTYFFYKGISEGKLKRIYLISLPSYVLIQLIIYIIYIILILRGIL